jgi:hypothetical protein
LSLFVDTFFSKEHGHTGGMVDEPISARDCRFNPTLTKAHPVQYCLVVVNRERYHWNFASTLSEHPLTWVPLAF